MWCPWNSSEWHEHKTKSDLWESLQMDLGLPVESSWILCQRSGHRDHQHFALIHLLREVHCAGPIHLSRTLNDTRLMWQDKLLRFVDLRANPSLNFFWFLFFIYVYMYIYKYIYTYISYIPFAWLMKTRKIHLPSCGPATTKCRALLKCRPRNVSDLGDWNLWKAGLCQCQMFKLEITCKTRNVELDSKRLPDYFWAHFHALHLVLLASMHRTTNHSDQSRSQSLGFCQCQVESWKKVTSAVNPLSRLTKLKSTHLLRKRWLFRQKLHSEKLTTVRVLLNSRCTRKVDSTILRSDV